MSIVVANELEGLKSSKKEKTSRAAEEALSYVKANNIRLLGVNGKLLAGEFCFFLLGIIKKFFFSLKFFQLQWGRGNFGPKKF